MKQILIETCCATAEDAFASAAAGIKRIELNSALALGGLTPSIGSLRQIKSATSLSVMAMLRPRGGGMCYSENEFETMCWDAKALLQAGADGLVFAVLQANGEIDSQRCRTILDLIGSKQAVFHRAFDFTPQPLQALEQLIQLGFSRILTSGQKPCVVEAVELIRRLEQKAAGRIEILPGGGLNLSNVEEFIRQSGSAQIHLTPRTSYLDHSTDGNPALHFGAIKLPAENEVSLVDRAAL
ncbi:MAG: copper homeostasis protein CutC [Negativicutes bacterium]|nr:copper homeostasis protein CutC [Negativicutes bacterium]